ncbi:MAG: pyrroline-5-carboxylate reductase [Planctomycetes bacterium]|nr:pyrroline-5-carboxylate reductase [Planctomycetota bacterium]
MSTSSQTKVLSRVGASAPKPLPTPKPAPTRAPVSPKSSGPLAGLHIAVIGAGKIGETLIQGLVDSRVVHRTQLIATTSNRDHSQALARKFHIRVAPANMVAVKTADIVLLCVKPQVMSEVLNEIRPILEPRQLLISVAAAVSTAYIERILEKPVPVVRCMPNTPCLIRAGMTGLCAGKHATAANVETARTIFDSVGRTVVLDERHMDAVTGLSASGPAFLYIVIEALAEGGVKVGLPRDVATELASQTMLGSARMVLETHEHPAKLKDAVTTPAGCTMDGILQLEEGGLRVTLIKAIVEATRRATELLHG